eukprot:5893731-Alexandrium_andersonii.AAC.1
MHQQCLSPCMWARHCGEPCKEICRMGRLSVPSSRGGCPSQSQGACEGWCWRSADVGHGPTPAAT